MERRDAPKLNTAPAAPIKGDAIARPIRNKITLPSSRKESQKTKMVFAISKKKIKRRAARLSSQKISSATIAPRRNPQIKPYHHSSYKVKIMVRETMHAAKMLNAVVYLAFDIKAPLCFSFILHLFSALVKWRKQKAASDAEASGRSLYDIVWFYWFSGFIVGILFLIFM